MPITVLNNAEGFDTGADSANKIYDRINSYAQNQMNIAAQKNLTVMNNASAEKRAIYAKPTYGAGDEQALKDQDTRITQANTNIYDTLSNSPTYDSPVAGQQAPFNPAPVPSVFEAISNWWNRTFTKQP